MRLSLTSLIYVDFGEANVFGYIVSTVNNDVAICLHRRCADDSGLVINSHWAAVLITERVWGLEDGSSCLWVVVRQPDHKVVQTMFYARVQTNVFWVNLQVKFLPNTRDKMTNLRAFFLAKLLARKWRNQTENNATVQCTLSQSLRIRWTRLVTVPVSQSRQKKTKPGPSANKLAVGIYGDHKKHV